MDGTNLKFSALINHKAEKSAPASLKQIKNQHGFAERICLYG